MTQEDRLKRLERIARLLSRAGLRLRKDTHELEAKINMIVTTQINFEDELKSSSRTGLKLFVREKDLNKMKLRDEPRHPES
jgi:hypothetical protein